jgi:hypothetical protein
MGLAEVREAVKGLLFWWTCPCLILMVDWFEIYRTVVSSVLEFTRYSVLIKDCLTCIQKEGESLGLMSRGEIVI